MLIHYVSQSAMNFTKGRFKAASCLPPNSEYEFQPLVTFMFYILSYLLIDLLSSLKFKLWGGRGVLLVLSVPTNWKT